MARVTLCREYNVFRYTISSYASGEPAATKQEQCLYSFRLPENGSKRRSPSEGVR